MSITLAIDVMSGDFGPYITIPASINALLSNKKIKLLLVGDPKKILVLLKKTNFNCNKRVKIIPSKSIVTNEITFSQALKNKDSSMHIALTLVKEGKAEACISAGNTSVLVGLSTLLLKKLDGIKRPALMQMLSTNQDKRTILLDLGANIKCNSNMLIQFSILGSVFAEEILKIFNPRVGLLNIGREENKGKKYIQEAAKFLRFYSKINYIGYVEGNELLDGKTDVLVCEGFVGNIMLKTMEGVIKMFFSSLKNNKIKKRIWVMSILTRYFQKDLIKSFDYFKLDQYNGAFLLGLKNIVIKSHGSSNKNAFYLAIKHAEQIVRWKVLKKISSRLKIILPGSN